MDRASLSFDVVCARLVSAGSFTSRVRPRAGSQQLSLSCGRDLDAERRCDMGRWSLRHVAHLGPVVCRLREKQSRTTQRTGLAMTLRGEDNPVNASPCSEPCGFPAHPLPRRIPTDPYEANPANDNVAATIPH